MVAAMEGVRRVLRRAGWRLRGGLAQEFLRMGAPVLEELARAKGEHAEGPEVLVDQDGFRVVRDPELNEPWRRVTGMTVVHEAKMTRAERRRGIGLLVEKLAEYVPVPEGAAVAEAVSCMARSCSHLELPMRSKAAEKVSPSSGVWASEGSTRQVLELFCADYNISAHQLNLLAREFRGVTATELVDGLRVEPVRRALAELLKVFAKELWGTPGASAYCLVMDKRLRVCAGDGAGSKYFVDPEEGWRRAEIYETRSERRAELLAAFDAGWNRGEFSREGFAAALGFRGFKELNRACLNVRGKSVRQFAYQILCEIVEFYLAAEVKALRELACGCEETSGATLRARYLYTGSCEKPTAEFADFWEACGDAEWRAGMEGWFSVD